VTSRPVVGSTACQGAALDSLESDHEFLTAGSVFTPDLGLAALEG
jgi:hypothetical protein